MQLTVYFSDSLIQFSFLRCLRTPRPAIAQAIQYQLVSIRAARALYYRLQFRPNDFVQFLLLMCFNSIEKSRT